MATTMTDDDLDLLKAAYELLTVTHDFESDVRGDHEAVERARRRLATIVGWAPDPVRHDLVEALHYSTNRWLGLVTLWSQPPVSRRGADYWRERMDHYAEAIIEHDRRTSDG